MKVVVNADDFGFSKGINLGILESFRNGVVSNTSLMTNMPGFEHAVELMRQYPELKVGLHVVTSVCKGLTRGLSVYDEDLNTQSITMNNYNYMNFINQLNSHDYTFEYAPYYGLDESLAVYNSTQISRYFLKLF